MTTMLDTMASNYNSSGRGDSNGHGTGQEGLGGFNLSDASLMTAMMTTMTNKMAAARSAPSMSEDNNSLALNLVTSNYLQGDEEPQPGAHNSLMPLAGRSNESDELFSTTVQYPIVDSEELEGLVNVTREYPFDYAMVMFGYIMPVVLIITFITNTLVVMVLYQRHMRTPTNIVLFTMAIVDLGTLLSPSPWYLYIYTFGNHIKFLYPPAACYAHHIMTDVIPIFFHTSSIWLALLLASQRYIYVCHPTLARTWCTVPRVKRAIFLILLVAFLHQSTRFFDNTFSAVTIFYQQRQHSACRNDIAPWVSVIDIPFYYTTYFVFRIFFVYLIPCVALITLNYLLFRALKRAENKRFELLKTKFKLVGVDTMNSYEANNHRNHRKGNCHLNHHRHNYSVAGYDVAREVSSFIAEPSTTTHFHPQVPLFDGLRHTRPSVSAGIVRGSADIGPASGYTTSPGPIDRPKHNNNNSNHDNNNNRCTKLARSGVFRENSNNGAGANCLRSGPVGQQDEPASALDRCLSQESCSRSSQQAQDDQLLGPPSTRHTSEAKRDDLDRTDPSSLMAVRGGNQQCTTAIGKSKSEQPHQGGGGGQCRRPAMRRDSSYKRDGRDVEAGQGRDSFDVEEEEGEEDNDGDDDVGEDDDDEEEEEEEESSICAECAAYERQLDSIGGAADLCIKCSAALMNDDTTTITACEHETGNAGSGSTSRAHSCQHVGGQQHRQQQHQEDRQQQHHQHQPLSQCSSILGGATNTTSNTNDDDISSSCLVTTQNASSSLFATQCGGLESSGGGGGGGVAGMGNYETIDSASIKADEGGVEEEEAVSGSGGPNEAIDDNNSSIVSADSGENDRDQHGGRNDASGSAGQQDGRGRQLEQTGGRRDELVKSGSADSRMNCGCLSAKTGPLRRITLIGKAKRRRQQRQAEKKRKELARQNKFGLASGNDYEDSAVVCSNSESSIKCLKRYSDTPLKTKAQLANSRHDQITAPRNESRAKLFKLSSIRSSNNSAKTVSAAKSASCNYAANQNCAPSSVAGSSTRPQVPDKRLVSGQVFQSDANETNGANIGDGYKREQLVTACQTFNSSTTANSHSTVSLLQVQDNLSNRTSNDTNRVLNSATSSSSVLKRQRIKSPSFASSIGGTAGGVVGPGAGGGGGSRATLIGSTAIPMIVSSNGQQGAPAAATMPAQSVRTMDSNRTTLMLVVVVTVFLVVEVPAAIVTIIHVVLNLFDLIKDVEYISTLNYIKLFTNFFIMISYSVNFTIYCSMSKKFRETFRDLWFCGRESKRKRAQRTLYQRQEQHTQYITTNN